MNDFIIASLKCQLRHPRHHQQRRNQRSQNLNQSLLLHQPSLLPLLPLILSN
jgi:hypothetical protein